MADEQKPLSRSEREAQIKDKAGLVIVIMALFMAITTYFSNSYSGAVLKNMLKATDTYSFYQSKSIKQTIAEGQLEDAKALIDSVIATTLPDPQAWLKVAKLKPEEVGIESQG